MKINCLGCGHSFPVDQAYENYDGQVKCNTCGTILAVKIEDGGIKSIEIVALSRRAAGEPGEMQTGK